MSGFLGCGDLGKFPRTTLLLSHFSQADQIHHFLLIKCPVRSGLMPSAIGKKQRTSQAGHRGYILKSHLNWELFGCKEKKTHSNKLREREYTEASQAPEVLTQTALVAQIVTSALFRCPWHRDLLWSMKS